MWKNRIVLSLLILVIGGAGLHARSPFLLAWRGALPWIFLLLGLGLAWKLLSRKAWALLMLLVCLIPLGLQRKAGSIKTEVLAANPEALRQLGGHFIVGYRDFAEIEALVARGAVGGVFVTQRNIVGKSAEQVRSDIRRLQELQARQGLPPLYIATDQEGGLVSRLSPLVPAQPSLAMWLQEGGKARDYAEAQAKALAELGVNLNFSPVVDLMPDVDGRRLLPHTLLEQRAISADPETVAAAAEDYCLAFERQGLRCTLKHFPGLGRVGVDTHLKEGAVDLSPEELERNDWLPFRSVLAKSQAFLMLGHVRVPKIDPEKPASISRPIVSGLIRETWGHHGVILTDDFTMGPIQGRPGGVGAASREALKAGVDLILISYDPELYYTAMSELLKDRNDGELQTALRESQKRLGQDLDRRAVGNQGPDLIHLGIGDSDAAVGPVIKTMQGAEIRHAIGQSVDHDGTARGYAAGLGGLPILDGGI